MSDSESKSPGAGPFGVPDSHFLRLAIDLLQGLELQSRERGHATLASLIDIAKTEAEGALRTNGDTSGETKLLRLVKAIRSQVSAATIENPAPVQSAAKPKPTRKRKTPSG